MTVGEYALKYLKELNAVIDMKSESSLGEKKHVGIILRDLLERIHKEMLQDLYDQNISLGNYEQWSKAISVFKKYNDKCNEIFKEMMMDKIIDFYKKQLEENNPTLAKLWDMSKNDIDAYAKMAKAANRVLGKRIDPTKKR